VRSAAGGRISRKATTWENAAGATNLDDDRQEVASQAARLGGERLAEALSQGVQHDGRIPDAMDRDVAGGGHGVGVGGCAEGIEGLDRHVQLARHGDHGLPMARAGYVGRWGGSQTRRPLGSIVGKALACDIYFATTHAQLHYAGRIKPSGAPSKRGQQ
jgi:hypothetical protein